MAYLALVCPVAAANWAKKGKVENASVGAVAGGLGTTNVKPDVGDTGAPVQYHTKKEYMKLTKEQCTELTLGINPMEVNWASQVGLESRTSLEEVINLLRKKRLHSLPFLLRTQR